MLRIGHGYDVHRLVEGRRLILGGVEVPHTLGLLGHSDADVLTHAVMDALLGAAGLGDIGRHFPDTDPAYAGADSLKLLDHVVELLGARGWQVGNVDATIPAQAGPVSGTDAGKSGGADEGCAGAGEREGHHGGEAGLHRSGGGDRRPCGVPAGAGVTGGSRATYTDSGGKCC